MLAPTNFYVSDDHIAWGCLCEKRLEHEFLCHDFIGGRRIDIPLPLLFTKIIFCWRWTFILWKSPLYSTVYQLVWFYYYSFFSVNCIYNDLYD